MHLQRTWRRIAEGQAEGSVSADLARSTFRKELHTTLLYAMATVAFQTMWGQLAREKKSGPETGSMRRPGFLDTCHALASNGKVVKKNWPAFYTGPAEKKG